MRACGLIDANGKPNAGSAKEKEWNDCKEETKRGGKEVVWPSYDFLSFDWSSLGVSNPLLLGGITVRRSRRWGWSEHDGDTTGDADRQLSLVTGKGGNVASCTVKSRNWVHRWLSAKVLERIPGRSRVVWHSVTHYYWQFCSKPLLFQEALNCIVSQ